MEDITFNSRSKEYKWLSNFAPCNLSPSTAPTIEHEYQAKKMEEVFEDKEYAAEIRALPTPQAAKKAGGKGVWVARMHAKSSLEAKESGRKRGATKKSLGDLWNTRMRTTWHPRSRQIMKGLTRRKYDSTLNPELHERLKKTGNKRLHEVGRPNFWTRAGQDTLGQVLEEVRDEIRD